MATVVTWEPIQGLWYVKTDGGEGEIRSFEDKASAIQSACDMEKDKDEPDCVLVYKKNGSGIADNIPISKDD